MRVSLTLLCILAVAACGEPPPSPASARSAASTAPSVLLVTVDTLRSDHTSVFGYDLETTPHLESLAARGVAFRRCVSQHPETGPSLTSMHTSRYPRETGVRENGVVLPVGFPTLAESFRKAGYRTGAFVSTYLLRDDACGLMRGFETYDQEMDSPNLGHPNFERRAEATGDRALAWLRGGGGGPFFLWVHLYDPHGLYDPGEDLARRFHRDTGRPDLHPSRIVEYQRFGDSRDPDDYVSRYDGEIFRADRVVGKLIEAVGEETLIAVTADHGEGLGEHDYWFRHGSLLDRPALRVPLVLAGPGVGRKGVVDRLVRNLDVAPTLLDLCGLAPLPSARGISLAGDVRGGGASGPVPSVAFSEARRMGGVSDRTGVDTRYKVSATTRAHRLVLWPETGEMRLFDLAADPEERLDVAAERPREADRLGAALRRWLAAADRLPGKGPDEAARDALRGLGYLDGRRGGDR